MAGFTSQTKDLVDIQVVPYPAVTIFIELGSGVLVDHAPGQQRRGSLAIGLAPSGVRARGRHIECLQIRLSPLLAQAVLASAAELGQTAAALDEFWGHDTARFEDQLHAAGSWDERFAIAEATLARRCQAGRSADPEVAFAWRQMVTSRGRVRVARLAAEAGWSRKRLWSRYRSQIGLTPKRAAQLIRFDNAAHRLAAGHSPALVAAEAGYADQSHLHRDTQAFAGLNPTAVAAAPWLAVDDHAWAPGNKQQDMTPASATAGVSSHSHEYESGTFLQDTKRCLLPR
jgi:AraC-like DNA-binding protein